MMTVTFMLSKCLVLTMAATCMLSKCLVAKNSLKVLTEFCVLQRVCLKEEVGYPAVNAVPRSLLAAKDRMGNVLVFLWTGNVTGTSIVGILVTKGIVVSGFDFE